MKQPDDNPRFGQNWAWPQKTWFRERLNAVKAREQESQRKPTDTPQKPAAVQAKPTNPKVSEEQ